MTWPLANVVPIAAAKQDDALAFIERLLAADKGPNPADWRTIQAAIRTRFEDETVGSIEEGLGLEVEKQGGRSFASRLRDARRLRALAAVYHQLDPEGRLGDWKGAQSLKDHIDDFETNWLKEWTVKGAPQKVHGKEPSKLLCWLYNLFVVYGDDGPPRSVQGLQNALKRHADST